MKEQSHKEEMSKALRGDFQRLRERGVPVALVPQDTPRQDESSNARERTAELREVPDPEPVGEPPSEPVVEPLPEAPLVSPVENADDAIPARKSWLSRLAGR